MAWNKPNTASQPVKKSGVKTPSKVKGIVAGIVIVAPVIALCLWMFLDGDDTAKEKTVKGRDRIKAVTPAALTNKVAEVKKHVDPREDYDHEKYYRDENGFLRYKSGCRAPDPLQKKMKTFKPSELSKPSIFSNECDEVIASLIFRKPGSTMGLTRNYYDPDLEAEYLESITTPIRINKDDSDSVKRQKQAVIDARKEIAQRIGDGEKLGDILSSAAKELRRLSDYKEGLENALGDMIEGQDMSTEDIKDAVKAANMMFEKEGLAPLKEDSFVLWNIRATAKRNGLDPRESVREYKEKRKETSE